MGFRCSQQPHHGTCVQVHCFATHCGLQYVAHDRIIFKWRHFIKGGTLLQLLLRLPQLLLPPLPGFAGVRCAASLQQPRWPLPVEQH